MKTSKRSLLLIILAVLVCFLVGCGTAEQVQDTVKIVFSERFLNVAEMKPDAWVEDLINTSNGQYVAAYVNDDGVSVTLEITEEQRSYWLDARGSLLKKLQDDFAKLDPNYKVQISDDYTHIDLYYNLELSAYNATYYVIYTETLCIGQQLFNGVGAEDWFVSFNIYNSDTGKLVTSGDSNTGLKYTAADWEASKENGD